MQAAGDTSLIRTQIPARMDRLPWSRWHWLVVVALGITWILDGLEVTIVGAIGGVLTHPDTLAFSETQVGLAGSIYILGAVSGALFFGYLTDRIGRKRMFMITLAVYLLSTVATAFSWNFWSFAFFRFMTGTGIGGEYAAINSAIDELIPARVRGWADLAINGSYWIGTIAGASATLLLLNPNLFSPDLGWRLTFGLGAVLGVAILLVRRHVPESPRWLMIHGRMDEANRIVGQIEETVKRDDSLDELPEMTEPPITIKPRGSVGFDVIARTMFNQYPTRSILGFSLMMGQAFFYNAIFFTYALVLTTFYSIPASSVGLYLIPFAIGNVLGPLTIGRLFDTIGRRPMITFTYVISGVLLAITGYLFTLGVLTAVTQTIAWTVIFFFASAGASSAYLTVSEIFPLEIRAMAIAFFYALGTGAGGFVGPVLFGALIETRAAQNVYYGYLVGAALMIIAGGIEWMLGVKAERTSLEMIAPPLSMVAGQPVPAETAGSAARKEPTPAMTLSQRLRPGRSASGMGVWSPPAVLSADRRDAEVTREIQIIQRALEDRGPMSRAELREAVGARYWGPERFRRALGIAVLAGQVEKLGRDRYGPRHQEPALPQEQRPAA